MRTGINHSGFVELDGQLTGVNLGADFCAEHEWGFDGIKRALGIPGKEANVFGIERRSVTAVPKSLTWFTGDVYQGIWLKPYSDLTEPGRVSFGRSTLWTGWAESDFGAFSNSLTEGYKLREVFEALQAKNAALWLGGATLPAFDNPGLIIAIADRLPADALTEMDKADRARHQLKIDAENTGIAARLKKAGKIYFALSPRRVEDGSLKFWLNPTEQNVNNCGWFTVSQLDQWIAGKGPIPKTASERRTQ